MNKPVETPYAPAAIGPYSQGVRLGNVVMTSGQIPVNPADGTIAETIEAQTKQSLENVAAVLAAVGAGLKDVVKTTVFVANMSDFPKVNAIYATFFSEGTLPARSCVEVSKLPKGVQIEIEAIAVVE